MNRSLNNLFKSYLKTSRDYLVFDSLTKLTEEQFNKIVKTCKLNNIDWWKNSHTYSELKADGNVTLGFCLENDKICVLSCRDNIYNKISYYDFINIVCEELE